MEVFANGGVVPRLKIHHFQGFTDKNFLVFEYTIPKSITGPYVAHIVFPYNNGPQAENYHHILQSTRVASQIRFNIDKEKCLTDKAVQKEFSFFNFQTLILISSYNP